MNISTSAPGKLFLMGEYAVLTGARALLLGVEKRAVVTIRPSSSACARIRAATESTLDPGSIPLLAAVFGELEGRGLSRREMLAGHEIELDTRDFFRSGKKLGLGSSAALMVAVVKALCSDIPMEDTEVLDLIMTCHAAFQGGQGSGADVATSLLGGCIEFQAAGFPIRIDLPGDLHMLFVWTGEVALTRVFLQRFDDWRRREPISSAQTLDELARVSGQAIDDLKHQRTGAFIRAVKEYNEQLMELSEIAGLGCYTPVHRDLGEAARSAGCAYKPSGAGGGDFGIAFSRDLRVLGTLKESLERARYFTMMPGASVAASEVLFEE